MGADDHVPRTRSGGEQVSRGSRKWLEQVPHIKELSWAVWGIHELEFADEFWKTVPELRVNMAEHPESAIKIKAAYDYLREHRPTPQEWGTVTHQDFFSQEEFDEYLEAFYDCLFGDRAEPIPAPGNERSWPDGDC